MDHVTTTRRQVGRCLVAAALLTGVVGTAPEARAAAPGENGRIAFVRDSAIWTVAPDGSDEEQITSPTGDDRDFSPSWSPGGTMIAYVHSTGGFEADLWTMAADGSAQQRRTASVHSDYSPSWSPDAAWIAFHSDRDARERTVTGEYYADIWTIATSGPSRLTRVTREEPHRRHAYSPAWSPERDGIAVASYGETGPNGIGIARWPTSAQRVALAAEHPGGAYGADWSPDGSTIVYHVFTDCCDGDLWTVTPGSEPQPIITGPTADLDASFSPDGTKIVFARDGVLHTADPGGGTIQSLGVEGSDPAWQPIPDEPLVDARFSPLGEHITWAREAGIATGCAPERFCPDRILSRGEAASFISHALDLPPATGDHFDDDTGSAHEDEINRLHEAGISNGCARHGGRFCPTEETSREMMAAWLGRALDPPPTTHDPFVDDERSPFEDEINRLAAAGVVSGCAQDRFCPGRLVTRAEAVALLHRAVE